MTTWWDTFRGRCVSCKHSVPSNRSNELLCTLRKAAHGRGLPGRPGGAVCWLGEPVHRMFGCVFFESANSEIEDLNR